MSRKKNGSPPACRLHKRTNQAVVTIDGHEYYLGEYGSFESKKKYNRLIRVWLDRQERQESEIEASPLLVS